MQNFAFAAELWRPGDKILIAVSGGADSMCLLDLLSRLKAKHDFELSVVHANYRLRGKDADADEAWVKKMAARYGIMCTVRRFRVSKAASEETLRDLRYAFFESLRQKTGCDVIAVAHNEDDQAETFLLRLLRGSGMTGLAGMRPKTGRVIRPLLGMSRHDILRYLEARQLRYRTDRSNADARYTRNRMRHELLPFLENEFQPRIRQVLAQTAGILSEEKFLLDSLVPKAPFRIITHGHAFSRSEALSYPEPLLRYWLRAMLGKMLGGRYPEKRFVDEIMKTLKSEKNKSQKITFLGLKLERKGDTVRLLKLSH